MKIGFTTGCWDLFHRGHQFFLRHCAENCSLLIVAVNSDEWCRTHKGPDRPKDPLVRRMANVRDEGWTIGDIRRRSALFQVIPFNGDDEALAAIIQPDIVFRGHDQSERPSAFPTMRIGNFPGFSTTLQASRSYK